MLGQRQNVAWVTAGALWLLPACVGPISATSSIVKAQVEIDAASHAEADKYAVYEMTKAREYLHKAREEAGYSDFQVAIKFADLAIANAEKAKERTLERPADLPAVAPQVPVSAPPTPSPPPLQIVPLNSAPGK